MEGITKAINMCDFLVKNKRTLHQCVNDITKSANAFQKYKPCEMKSKWILKSIMGVKRYCTRHKNYLIKNSNIKYDVKLIEQ